MSATFLQPTRQLGLARKFNYRTVYSTARKNAVKRHIPFLLTHDEYAEIVKKADGHCMVSGIKFSHDQACGKSRRRPFAPSLDRINSDLGYSKANCRLVAVIVNIAMNEWGERPLIQLAQALYASHLDPNAKPITTVNRETYVSAKEYLDSIKNSSNIKPTQLSIVARQICISKGFEIKKKPVPRRERVDGFVPFDYQNAYPVHILKQAYGHATKPAWRRRRFAPYLQPLADGK